ncbi:YIP1 family protein [Herbivorax sp. ANBcel31]|uniref:YIP1 family protein n=1 Tax=Herbivorax sp. ANBcel31 TaxID=3069754 RepID=UPI0027B1CFB4|nr:YIP1 family protein [Herbivorax sp. ANBcel31]MDQ2087567.1 YIP1 family protein [Herbivorax sp. ANBcel31]
MSEINISNQVDDNELGAIQRIVGVFVSPGKVMKSLVENPKVLLPIILIIIVPVITILLNYPAFRDALMMLTEAELAELGEEFTPEMMGVFAVILAITLEAVSLPIYVLIGSLILWGILKIFQGKGRFKQYLSVVSHALLIYLLMYVVNLLVSYTSGEFDIYSSITSLGTVLPESLNGTFIYGMLSNVEVFDVWSYCVIGIGVSEVSCLSKAKSYSIVAALYFVGLLFSGIMHM